MADNWFFILCCAFVLAWVIQFVLQLSMWQMPWRKLCKLKRAGVPSYEIIDGSAFTGGVSVLVYAHNHCEQLKELLDTLLTQDYPDYEVIVINDNSVDDTMDLLTGYSIQYPNFTYTRIGENVRSLSRRKLALLLGVKKAKGDYILTTNDHCIPASKHWISCMVRQFKDSSVEAVLGPVCFSNDAPMFYKYDLFRRMKRLFGLTMMVRPFSAWAQNMAFTKDLFWKYEVKAAQKYLNIIPGEDDIFISNVANEDNVQVECSAEAMIFEREMPVGSFWKVDRLTRAFSSKYCRLAPRLVNRLEALSRYLTVLSGLALAVYFVMHAMWIELSVVLCLLLLRAVLILVFDIKLTRGLGLRIAPYCGLLFDLVMPLVDLWFHIKGKISVSRFRSNNINPY